MARMSAGLGRRAWWPQQRHGTSPTRGRPSSASGCFRRGTPCTPEMPASRYGTRRRSSCSQCGRSETPCRGLPCRGNPRRSTQRCTECGRLKCRSYSRDPPRPSWRDIGGRRRCQQGGQDRAVHRHGARPEPCAQERPRAKRRYRKPRHGKTRSRSQRGATPRGR